MNQAGPELGGAELAVLLGFYGVVFLVVFGIQLLISYLMYRAAKALPPEFQSQAPPGSAFLMLIPLFNIIWVFIYPKNLSQAYQAYLGSTNQLRDDCGEQHATYWAIAQICSIIPCVGAIAGIASLVFMIMYLVKINECKKQAEAMGGYPPTGGPMSGGQYGGGPSPNNPYRP